MGALRQTIFCTDFGRCLVDGSKSASQGKPASDKSEIERGRYLVEEVAKCVECHTPRDPNGDLKHDAWLQGAPIWITPVKPIRNWADPPMHIFHMKHEDAKAIMAYLKSLPRGQQIRNPLGRKPRDG